MTPRAAGSSIAGLVILIGAACAADTQDRADREPAPAEPIVVASGLNGPMGVLVEPDGTIWVIDSGVGGEQVVQTVDPVSRQVAEGSLGETARVIRVDPSGEQTFAHLPSLFVGGIGYGGARLAMLDGVLYATSGGFVIGGEEPERDWRTAASGDSHSGVVRVERGRVTELVNTWDIETRQNPDPAQLESNPYGLAAGPDGMLWMSDAAGNTLYRVDPEARSIELVAVFQPLPGATPNPNRNGALEVEPVPTGIAFMDGEAYVAFLPGLPMAPGSAKVVRVSADGEVSDYATGLSRLTDLQLGPDGNLYAVSMGVPAEGPTGSVIRIGPGTSSETVLSGLPLPTAIAFDGDGNAYVTTNGLGEPGSGQLLEYSGLVQVRRPST